jgi:serine/threonine protein kinase
MRRSIATQIAGGLAAAQAGIVHRDLKPDNVLFTKDAGVKPKGEQGSINQTRELCGCKSFRLK